MVSNVLLVAPVLFSGGMVFLRSVDELTVDRVICKCLTASEVLMVMARMLVAGGVDRFVVGRGVGGCRSAIGSSAGG